MKIGFIGLGIMGLPMAKNLLKHNYDLMVNTHKHSTVESLLPLGAKEGSYREIGESCDVIFTMLPDGPQVEEVMLGENGVGQFMRPGSVYIDTSSIDPQVSKRVAAVLEKRGVEMLDAPVSGGEPKAIDGTLSFMVGGKEEIFNRYQSLLLVMGSSAVRCGDIGSGNMAKLANQIIVACNIRAAAEALTLAKAAGVDPESVFQAIRGGLAGSTVLEAKVPMMLSGNDQPGFRIDLHIKDLKNALRLAYSIGAPVPMTESVHETFKYLSEHGYGQKDHSALIHYYEMLVNSPS